MIKYQGKTMGMGYAQAIASYLKQSTKIDHLILKIHLDDCYMKDEQFSTILEGVRSSKLGVSLQNITYSNNQMGAKSIDHICHFINLSEMTIVKCLKELHLSNINIKNMKDTRKIFECLAENGSCMTSLRFSQMNLCDSDVLYYLGEFLTNNKELKCLELSGCHL